MTASKPFFERFAEVVVTKRRLMVLLTLIMAFAVYAGIPNLRLDTDGRVFMGPDNPDKQMLDRFEQEFAKDDNMNILVIPKDGKVFTPETLQIIDALTEEAWNLPYVRLVNSITRFQNSYADGDMMMVEDLILDPESVSQAEADAAKSGYDISHYYTLATNDDGSVALKTADSGEIDASGLTPVDQQTDNPDRSGYDGYLLGTSDSPNGAPYGMGISFPTNNQNGDYFLRTDFMPKRLFKYDGGRWVKMQDGVRVDLTNTDTRNTQKTTFINNTKTNEIGGEQVQERQSLSKALRPKADN